MSKHKIEVTTVLLEIGIVLRILKKKLGKGKKGKGKKKQQHVVQKVRRSFFFQ